MDQVWEGDILGEKGEQGVGTEGVDLVVVVCIESLLSNISLPLFSPQTYATKIGDIYLRKPMSSLMNYMKEVKCFMPSDFL